MVKQLTPEEALRRVEKQMANNRERAKRNAKAIRAEGWKRLVLLVPPGKGGEQVAEAIKGLHRQLVNDAGLKPPTAASRKRERTAGSAPSGATVAPQLAKVAPVAPAPNPLPQQAAAPGPVIVTVPGVGQGALKLIGEGDNRAVRLAINTDGGTHMWILREPDYRSQQTFLKSSVAGGKPVQLNNIQLIEVRRMFEQG